MIKMRSDIRFLQQSNLATIDVLASIHFCPSCLAKHIGGAVITTASTELSRFLCSLVTTSAEFLRLKQQVGQTQRTKKAINPLIVSQCIRPPVKAGRNPADTPAFGDLGQCLLRVCLHRIKRAIQKEANRSRSSINRITLSRKRLRASLTRLGNRTLAVVAVKTSRWNNCPPRRFE